MLEVIIIVSLSLIFIILLRRVPDVKIEGIDEKGSKQFEANRIIKEIDKEFDDKRREVIYLLSQAEKCFIERDYQKAEEYYLKIATLDPENSKIYGRLGIIYFEQKDYYDAASSFIEAIRHDPNNSFLYNNLGLVSFYLRDYQKSINAYRKAIELDPTAAKFINLARAYEEIKAYQEAISAVNSALNIDPNNSEYKRMLADLQAKTAINED